MSTEPVRVAVWIAAAVASLGTFFTIWAQTGDWRLAVGAGLLAFALPAGGAEVARSRVTPIGDAAAPDRTRIGDKGAVNLLNVLIVLGIIALVLVIVYFVDISVDLRGA